ncbi:MAG: hypothetical protein AAGH15_00140, partial [Myxococcota bacterium]
GGRDAGRDAAVDAGSCTASEELCALWAAEEAAKADELPLPPGATGTLSSMLHFSPARRASTWVAGPTSDDVTVQVRDYEGIFGAPIGGASPVQALSTRRYAEDPAAYTIWGATLTRGYRFVVSGARFEALDLFDINTFFAPSLPWNIVALDDGRVIVPDTDGHRVPESGPCRTTDPSLVVFRDDDRLDGSVRCEKSVALTPAALREACGLRFGRLRPGFTGNSQVRGFGGEHVTTALFDVEDVERAFMIVMDGDLEGILACGAIDESAPSNEIAAEPGSEGRTFFYVPAGNALVKMVYDPRARTVTRAWARGDGFRQRTGTTPTLVNAPDGRRFVVVVDGPCATSNIVNGLITCDEDAGRARLVAVRREDELAGEPSVQFTELPEAIRTVENSPASRRDWVFVANYSGYLPNGLVVPPGGTPPEGGVSTWGVSPDAAPDVARGIVGLRYDVAARGFVVAWTDLETQVSGIPSVSGGANMVYGTGAEEATGKTYVYGWRWLADEGGPAGERLLRIEVGDAPFRTPTTDASGNRIFRFGDYELAEGEVYDAGNSLAIGIDGSLFMSMGRALVRVRPNRPPRPE